MSLQHTEVHHQRDLPPGNGDEIDYFGMFYDDVLLSSLVDMTNNYYE